MKLLESRLGVRRPPLSASRSSLRNEIFLPNTSVLLRIIQNVYTNILEYSCESYSSPCTHTLIQQHIYYCKTLCWLECENRGNTENIDPCLARVQVFSIPTCFFKSSRFFSFKPRFTYIIEFIYRLGDIHTYIVVSSRLNWFLHRVKHILLKIPSTAFTISKFSNMKRVYLEQANKYVHHSWLIF